MDLSGAGWGLQTIIGAVLLAAVIAWAALRNRADKGSENRTEEATRELYREEDAAHKDEETGNVP